MRVVAIVGRQGSGKTTLIERLIPAMQARGLTVSRPSSTPTITTSNSTRPARTVTDTAAREASEVIIASDTGWARIAAATKPASLPMLLGAAPAGGRGAG